jgi:hypothetical protein
MKIYYLTDKLSSGLAYIYFLYRDKVWLAFPEFKCFIT